MRKSLMLAAIADLLATGGLLLLLGACQPLYGGKPERLPVGHEPSRQRVMEREAELRALHAHDGGLDDASAGSDSPASGSAQ